MSTEEDIEDEPGFFRRHRVVIGIAVVILFGALAFSFFGGKSKPKRSSPPISMVSLVPPPPPPPPPKIQPTPPPPEPKEQPEEKFQAEEKPDEAPPEPKADAPPDLGTNIKGDGPPDGFGLSGSGNGSGNGSGTGGGGGTRFGAYAGMVQKKVVEALGNHKRTRSSKLSMKVRVWADSSGRITKVTLEGTSGDAATDNAIKNEALAGLQLREPPPKDMPMPIVMRITAKRP